MDVPVTPLRHRLLVLVAVLATLVAGCGTDRSSRAARPAATTTTAPGLYVAIGASDSVGIGSTNPAQDAWPEVFRHMALPASTRFANLAVPGATLASALSDQVPKAVAMRPSLVTVWLNVNDLRDRVRPADFERGLERLVEQLRKEGGARVLVANVPPLDHLPAVRFVPIPVDLVDREVDAYNAATDGVARRQHAILVDLHAAGLAARAAGTEPGLVSADGFHPSTAGYALVARTFADALRAAP